MFISEVKARNFRVFSDFAVRLSSGLNIIVGENNSGKTALVDAIRYALTANAGEWAPVRERDFRRGERTFEIRLRFDDIEARQARAFVEHLTHEKNGDGTRRSVLFVNFSAQLTDEVSRNGRVIRTDVRSGEHADGPAIEREARDYLSATYLRPLRDAEAELMGGRGSRLAQILNSSSQFANLAVVEELLRIVLEANAKIIENAAIGDARGRIEAQIREIDFKHRPLSPKVSIVGGKSLDGIAEPGKRQMLRSVLERLQLEIDEIDPQQGLGYSNLLFMATELLLLKQEQDEYPLLLAEEPEAHLHPQLQMKFLSALVSADGGIGDSRLQSILTTHSPNFASKAPLESVIVMEGGKAFPLRRGDTHLGDDDYVFLEKFLDATKANLFFAKAVLIVEGAGENILLPTICQLLGLPLEDHAASIVNVGSRAYARFARIFRRRDLDGADPSTWLGTKVVCISDRDLWPEKAKKEAGQPLGFIEWKDGNKHYWKSYYADDEAIAARDAGRKVEQGQNVRVELSDHWTFEYDLVRSGLAWEVAEASGMPKADFDELPADEEERAVAIYGGINGKTELAYALIRILTREYGPQKTDPPVGETSEQAQVRQTADLAATQERRAMLLQRLPRYIVRTIDFITSVPEVTAAGGA